MLVGLKAWIIGLKAWTISLVLLPGGSEFTPYALWALFGIAFAESSFFPIPPDIPFILMGVARPNTAYHLAFLLSIGSVLGGACGYAIGYYGGRPLVEWLVSTSLIGRIFSHEKFETVEHYYQKYDFWAVLIAAFTPLPYKVFTIGGGLCRIAFGRFMLVSLIGRASRFFLVGTMLYFWGHHAHFILSRFDLFLIAMLILGILGFLAMGLMKTRQPSNPGE